MLSIKELQITDLNAHNALLCDAWEQSKITLEDTELTILDLFTEILDQTEIYLTDDLHIVSYWEDPHCPFNAGDDAYMIWDNKTWIPLENSAILTEIRNAQ